MRMRGSTVSSGCCPMSCTGTGHAFGSGGSHRRAPRPSGAPDSPPARGRRRLTGAGGRGQLHALAGGNDEGDVIENGTTVESDGEVYLLT